jgi:WD40 repeat protein
MIQKCVAFALCIAFACVLLASSRPADAEPEARPSAHRVLGKARDGYALAFSPDGKHLMAAVEQRRADTNDQIVEWDIETGKASRSFDPGHGGQVRAITYSESGRFMAIGHLDGFVSVRDAKGEVVLSFMSLEGLLQTLRHVSISEDDSGPYVHTVVGRHIAQTRSIPAGKTHVYYIDSDVYGIGGAAMPRNGTTLVCCTPLFLQVFGDGDFSSGTEMKSFKVFDKPGATDVAVSDDASAAMVAEYRHGELALFDLKNDKLIKRWGGRDDPPIYAILPFHGRNWFATGDDSGAIQVWDEKGELRATLKKSGYDGPVAALAITGDNRFLASSGEGRPVVIWDLQPIIGKKGDK